MPAPTPSMRGRRVLVTGATDGIGRHTATGLARLGAEVLVVGRDATRGHQAAATIARDSGNPAVEFLTADLSSQAAVRALATEVTDRYGRLDVLVNNIGGLYTERWTTVDGIEASLAVNALNPFLLTSLLRGTLAAAPSARVVYVTGGFPTRVDPDDLQNTRDHVGIRAYSHAKGVMMALAHEQAARTPVTDTTVGVVYPGAADTPMTRAMRPGSVPLTMKLIWPLFRPMMSRAKPERAALSSIRLASDPGFDGVTGVYLKTGGERVDWPRTLPDAAVRRRLWDVAHQLTGLPLEDPAGLGR